MSRVLFVYERNIPTVALTREMFSNVVLKEHGIDVSFKSIFQIKKADVNENDILFLIRPTNCLSAAIAQKAQKCGKFVVTFCDDDLLNLPPSLPNIPWRKRALLKSLKNSNVVCSSSPYICKKYVDYTISGRYAIMNSTIDDKTIRNIGILKTNSENKKIKLVYAAGAGHSTLFEKYIFPIIGSLAREYGNAISLTFVGVHPDIKECENIMKINYVESMKLDEYRAYMINEGFDIGLAPLHDDDFSKCKYFNKFIEYTITGIVGVYSNVEPYTFIVENEKNGMLANNDFQSWETAIKKLIEDSELRKHCLCNACQKLSEEFNIQTIVKQLIKSIPELVAYKPSVKVGGIACARLKYKLLRPLDLIYVALFTLRHGGMREFFKRLKAHNMEKKAITEIEK